MVGFKMNLASSTICEVLRDQTKFFAPCRAMELLARVISCLHDNPTRGDFETWSKQSKITCKQSSNLRTQHGIIHILQNDINTYGARTQKLTKMFFC